LVVNTQNIWGRFRGTPSDPGPSIVEQCYIMVRDALYFRRSVQTFQRHLTAFIIYSIYLDGRGK